MATRTKTPQTIAQIDNGDPWRQVSEPLEMANGAMAIHWRNTETGQTRIVPAGMHPDDQALESYSMTAPDEPEEETATDRVAAMLSNVTGSPDERAEVKVYRVVEGALQYCRGFKPDEFENGNFDMLRDRYGPGEYELRLYATNPASRKFVVRNKLRVTIAAEILTTPDGFGGSGMGQVLATIAQGQAQMLEALVSIKQAPARDPMEEMTKMLAMMTAMREAMGINNQPREKSSIGEIVSAIRELRGAADELSPEKKEPDSLLSALPQVLDLVSKGMQSQPAAMPPVYVPESYAAQPQQNQQPQPQPDQQPETQENADMKALALLKLHGYMKSLVTMAEQKKTHDEGATFVYEKLPDELVEIMALENWFDLLAAVAPGVKDHKAWLTAVRDKALTMFEPE
jgi:hypothetical protein